MTTVALDALPQFFDNSGNPLSGGKLFTYSAGTLIPLATYTDRSGTVPNANPVVLNSSGRADIWLQTNIPYQLILQDSVGNVIDSVDNYYAGADPAQLTAAGIVPATGGTYTGLVSFTGGATFDGTPAQDLATLDSLNIAAAMTANLWMNPDFFINQRVATTAADGAIGFDRARVLCETGSLTLTSFDTAGATLAGNAGRFLQPDAAPKRFGLQQIVEAKDCLSYRGQNLVLAAQVRCSASTTVRCALVAWTGAQDSPTFDVVNNWASTNYTAGNFFVASTSTIATAATAVSSGVWTDIIVSSTSAGGIPVPLTMKNLYMVIWTEAQLAQNVTLDVTSVRCGRGTTAPLWTNPIAQVELAKCRRFLHVWQSASANDHVCLGQCVTTLVAFMSYLFDVEMRIAPATVIGAGPFSVSTAAGVPQVLTAIGPNTFNKRGMLMSCSIGAPNLIAGNAAYLQGTATNSQLLFSAEL